MKRIIDISGNQNRCENCQYWKPASKDIGSGECRISAPVFTNETHRWPLTRATDACALHSENKGEEHEKWKQFLVVGLGIDLPLGILGNQISELLQKDDEKTSLSDQTIEDALPVAIDVPLYMDVLANHGKIWTSQRSEPHSPMFEDKLDMWLSEQVNKSIRITDGAQFTDPVDIRPFAADNLNYDVNNYLCLPRIVWVAGKRNVQVILEASEQQLLKRAAIVQRVANEIFVLWESQGLALWKSVLDQTGTRN